MKTITIVGMHCQHCVAAVEEALLAVPGVTKVSVTLEPGQALVEGVDLKADALKEAIEETGFDVIAIA